MYRISLRNAVPLPRLSSDPENRVAALRPGNQLHRDLARALTGGGGLCGPLSVGVVALVGAEDVARHHGTQHMLDLLKQAEESVATLAKRDRQLTAYRIGANVLGLLLADARSCESLRIAEAVCLRVAQDAPGLRACYGLAHYQPTPTGPTAATATELYQEALTTLDECLQLRGDLPDTQKH